MRKPATWRKLIKDYAGDDKIIACTLTEEELDTEFVNEYGGNEGKPFYAWSECYVYFSVNSDGVKFVASVPRNPGIQATSHIGG